MMPCLARADTYSSYIVAPRTQIRHKRHPLTIRSGPWIAVCTGCEPSKTSICPSSTRPLHLRTFNASRSRASNMHLRTIRKQSTPCPCTLYSVVAVTIQPFACRVSCGPHPRIFSTGAWTRRSTRVRAGAPTSAAPAPDS